MSAILEMRGVDAFYGERQVLFKVDLAVEAGSSVALLGANGAGKTTTLRAICGMLKTTGEISFKNRPISGRSTHAIIKSGVGHVPDGRGTFAGLTVDDNLRVGAYLRRDPAVVQHDRERMFRYFPRLRERLHQQAGTLSGGEQQMLAIARALLSRPLLLLLDEPSFGLAPIVVREIFAILREIRQQEATTMLIVEQNARQALQFVDEALLMETGRIVLRGSPDTIGRNDEVRRSYLGF
jgi:branched-chain amino acid transport system ATP-binding protein